MNIKKTRIIILGPVVTKSYFGGVATFDEGLAKSLVSCGCEVLLATSQKDAGTTADGIEIKRVSRRSFRELVQSFQPDYIISELGYAKYYVLNKCRAKKIYYLHAFFKQSYYGVLKARLAVLYQKILIKFSDIVIANSHFTAMVNRDFYGIESDAVCEVGLKDDFCKAVLQNISLPREKNSVFFAARFVPAKGAEKVIEAAKMLYDQGERFHLYIAGDGPERERIASTIEKSNLPITYLGRLNQSQMVEQYLKSEVFISLDRSEPYGIVFLEALVAGCKIVCPVTGGQMEILKDYRDYVSYVDVNDIKDISIGIRKALNNEALPQLSEKERLDFSYMKTAKKLLGILERFQK